MSRGIKGAPSGRQLAGHLYAASFLVALAGFAILNAGSNGAAFAAACFLIGIVSAAGLFLPHLPPAPLLTSIGLAGAALVTLLVPIGRELTAGNDLPRIVREHFVWPQILVLLFASRIAADLAEGRLARFWRAPASLPAGTSIQSLGAAVLLGLALTLAWYRLLPEPDGVDSAVSRALLSALAGASVLHVMIVILFGVLMAGLFDAARAHAADRVLLRALARRSDGPIEREAFDDLLVAEGALRGRTARVLARRILGDDGRLAALDAFDEAARGFLRGLLPVLPLLGFLGTVVGLAIAVADLPAAIGAEAGSAGLARVLGGLAVQFETTLMGLLFSIIGGLLLALLEKAEAQARAGAALLARRLAEAGHDRG